MWRWPAIHWLCGQDHKLPDWRVCGLCLAQGPCNSAVAPKLGQELAGVKIDFRRLIKPGYAARRLVSDGITLPA